MFACEHKDFYCGRARAAAEKVEVTRAAAARVVSHCHHPLVPTCRVGDGGEGALRMEKRNSK